MSKETTEFRLYEDGSLKTPDGSFQSEEFCIEQMKKTTAENQSRQLVARYCVNDPCIGTECIRKCCPDGMAFQSGFVCETFVGDFHIQLQNEQVEITGKEISNIYHGAPQCSKLIPLQPDTNELDIFYVLPNSLYFPAYPKDERFQKNYCVDDMVSGNDTVSTFFSNTPVNLKQFIVFMDGSFRAISFYRDH